MRILHTSDWHLGRQFYNQSLLADQRHVLEQICTIVAEREVEVVIVAGDLYDRSVPPAAAVELLDQTVSTICQELGVPLIMIAGNHDGPERLAFGARQLAAAGLHVVGKLWQQPRRITLQDRGGQTVAFYPLPYVDPATVRFAHEVDVSSHQEAFSHLVNMIVADMDETQPTVLIAHCFLLGGEGSESERPLSLGGIEYVDPALFSPFAYTALGHLHGAQSRQDGKIAYSGSPLKYSFSEERQRKTVTLVDLEPDGKLITERIALEARLDMRTLEGELAELLVLGQNDPQRDDYLQVRLTDSQAILDVMTKLRAVYPNVLHLERPGLMQRQQQLRQQREQLQRGELAMFEDFFQQTTGVAMGAEQCAIIRQELEQLQREDY